MKRHLLAFATAASLAFPVLAANPTVELKTSQGDIVVEVFADKAPKSAENFVQYVKDGFYDGTVFHRVIDGFMVQGGGFDASMNQKATRAPIENEAKNGLKNERGTLAMARTSDPHSASAQFFINLVPNTFLDYPSRDGWGYAVFGKVVKGMEVVDKIAKLPTANRGFHQNVPVEAIVVESARVVGTATPAKKPAK
ncbi:peptidylprolyl isomerase [Thauera aminoaromatica]|uniref:peptidylprolyl isomerase n=1 Tax=Thauera aminoaromatica TaxID=164330 RepID=UPI00235319D0|nr:peptidylprolyl isomerase [Thauera aminoaromatica]MCK6398401.1 peptidyl-prolyl cis-trans isomerase [Thauera aminoaromatica]